MYSTCLLQDENLNSRRGGTTTIWDSGIGGLSSTSNIATQLEGEEDSMNVGQQFYSKWRQIRQIFKGCQTHIEYAPKEMPVTLLGLEVCLIAHTPHIIVEENASCCMRRG